MNHRRRLEQGPDVLLELAHLVVQPLDLLEQVAGGVGRTGWQELETLPHEGAAACVEEVTDLEVVEGVLGQGRVNAILELGALANEHHARAAAGRAGRAARPGESRPLGVCRCVGAD